MSPMSASLPSPRTRQSRVYACRSDLLENGIDLNGGGHRRLCRLVWRHLDYFQLMLGYDAAPAEIVSLCERSAPPPPPPPR